MEALVSFRILVNGSAISDVLRVLKIETQASISGVSQSTITFDLIDQQIGSVVPRAINQWVFGDVVEIKAGYDANNASIFEGVLLSKTLMSDSSQGVMLEVFCQNTENKWPENHNAFDLTYGINVFSSSLVLKEGNQLTGKITTQGNSALVPGMELNTKDFGPEFDSTIKISTVSHQISEGDWITGLVLGEAI